MSDPVTRSVTVAAPAARVMAVVSDLANTDRWANEAKSADVAARDDAGRPTRMVITLGALGFTTTATYTVAYTDTSVTLECVEGALIDQSTIVYTLQDLGDDRTELTMSATMEVTVPGIPRWGLDQVMGSSAQKNLESVRQDAEAAEDAEHTPG